MGVIATVEVEIDDFSNTDILAHISNLVEEDQEFRRDLIELVEYLDEGRLYWEVESLIDRQKIDALHQLYRALTIDQIQDIIEQKNLPNA